MSGRRRLAGAVGLLVAALWLAAPAGAQTDPAGGVLPASIPIFPLREVVLFPDTTRALYIFEPRYRAMVEDALAGDRIIGTVLIEPGFEADDAGTPPVRAVGCAGMITRAVENDDGTWNIELFGLARFRIIGEDQRRAYRVADVEALPERFEAGDAVRLGIQRRRIEALLVGLGAQPPPAALADDLVVQMLAGSVGDAPVDRQALLELEGPAARGDAVIAWLERTVAR